MLVWVSCILVLLKTRFGAAWNGEKKPSIHSYSFQIRSDQLLSHVRLFATPWITAHQASLSIPNSRSSLRLTSIESVMPSSHLILCHPLLLLPPIPPSIRVFSNESTLCMRWPKYWSFSFSIIPSKEHPGVSSASKHWLLGWISFGGTNSCVWSYFTAGVGQEQKWPWEDRHIHFLTLWRTSKDHSKVAAIFVSPSLAPLHPRRVQMLWILPLQSPISKRPSFLFPPPFPLSDLRRLPEGCSLSQPSIPARLFCNSLFPWICYKLFFELFTNIQTPWVQWQLYEGCFLLDFIDLTILGNLCESKGERRKRE